MTNSLLKPCFAVPALLFLLLACQAALSDTPIGATFEPGERIAGLKATSSAKTYEGDALQEYSPADARILQEYLVNRVLTRDYEPLRVAVFETQSPASAFGLYSYYSISAGRKDSPEEIGQSATTVAEGLVFWQGNAVVRISSTSGNPLRVAGRELAFSRALAGRIPPSAAKQPALLANLPSQFQTVGSVKYVIGPEALSQSLPNARDLFLFFGDAEAAVADYEQQGSPAPIRLALIEYHTPQFATDAMVHLNEAVAGLPQQQQDQLLIKRQGNYIIAAANVVDHDRAQMLVDSIEYPYTVKWLRNPLWPTNDPFRVQKAAAMLVSTFGLLGLILLTVIVGGTIFGTSVFLRRRKQGRQAFSDAGGMLRLDLDPFESVILGLPPKRTGED